MHQIKLPPLSYTSAEAWLLVKAAADDIANAAAIPEVADTRLKAVSRNQMGK